MKFAKLTIMLNVILLLAALSVIALFGVIPYYSMAIAVVCAVSAVLLSVIFKRHYDRDKSWLMSQD
ncbi:hypothetical protein [Methanoplanus endosymbiosus]|uniref:Uncharacterized protein n=1 Tax=Methanoplanus endosymbiosus TaxID=33865 RepID=A0A9E7PRC2_9EURY|nr:hypothetical protein [Methanoplanus endosymbiosus]UUX93654.1 hypothetical protein L6E24_05930 [Methanoplanus endosymbiosus]